VPRAPKSSPVIHLFIIFDVPFLGVVIAAFGGAAEEFSITQ
jgi:hypothetical protein